MDAINLLERQHHDVDALFDQLAGAESELDMRRVFFALADLLVIHSTIEERHFYPAVRARETESVVKQSYDAHDELKQRIADLLELDAYDDEFSARCDALEIAVQQHVTEERATLFPRARELLDEAQLDALGQEMAATMA